jgi:hypothetical protein
VARLEAAVDHRRVRRYEAPVRYRFQGFPLGRDCVAEILAGDPAKPQFVGQLITEGHATYVIDVGTLVWSVAAMLRRLLGDETQIQAAENVARQLRGTI